MGKELDSAPPNSLGALDWRCGPRVTPLILGKWAYAERAVPCKAEVPAPEAASEPVLLPGSGGRVLRGLTIPLDPGRSSGAD